jgi:hypothetical protein
MAKRKSIVATGMTEEKAAAIQATAVKQILHSEADQISCLSERGNLLAKNQKYQGVEGLDAIRYFLMQKHNWTPSQVKSMSHEDLLFAFSQEP